MICPHCSFEFEKSLPSSVNARTNPEAKEKILNGELFLARCPSCSKTSLVGGTMLYTDPSQKLLVALTPVPLKAEGIEGWTCRQVQDAGSLIEKVKIFDAGLDDVVVELCKSVTMMEMKKPGLALKFLKLDGPDGDMILTYPSAEGRMEMLSLGANVYSDCAGIVSRNPLIRPCGLALVDADYISRFIE